MRKIVIGLGLVGAGTAAAALAVTRLIRKSRRREADQRLQQDIERFENEGGRTA